MESKTYLGAPCRHGHDGTRYKKNNICVACHKKYTPLVKVWCDKNKERKAATNKIWYEKNKQRKREKQKAWNENNPDRLRIHYQNRKSRVGDAKISLEQVSKLIKLQKGCCAICKMILDCYEIDHVVPLFLGGKHDSSNIQILCPHCNRTKHAKDPIDFMQSKGYLL